MSLKESYPEIDARLNEIVEEVKREDISLDEALKLYDEAVKLALKACDLSEEDFAEKAASEVVDETTSAQRWDETSAAAEQEQ